MTVYSQYGPLYSMYPAQAQAQRDAVYSYNFLSNISEESYVVTVLYEYVRCTVLDYTVTRSLVERVSLTWHNTR
jgi:hypothetical protein